MTTKYKPVYTLNSNITHSLQAIESTKEKIKSLLLESPNVDLLYEKTKIEAIHYSTFIEGNRLNVDQIKKVITFNARFPGCETDENEVKGYYAALTQLEHYIANHDSLSEKMIQTLHALVMSDGRTKVAPTSYRQGQNVIKNSATGAIVYMPPEAKEVPELMKNLVEWIKKNKNIVPCPIIAAITHYQFATIHPYYDGNGRTARLLTTLVLHLGGFGLKGLYSLEEYYAKDLNAYYEAISIGPSHNYYLGREESDITEWIAYFCKGMAYSFEKVVTQMIKSEKRGEPDQSEILRVLDPTQRKLLELFKEYEVVTNSQIAQTLELNTRSCAALCKKWVDSGFLEIVDPSNKARTYTLSDTFNVLLKN